MSKQGEGRLYDEKDLTERLKNGEEAAFETLVKAHQREIYHLALKMMGNHDDADEVTQRTFINVYRKIATFKGKSKLRTWIYRIAVNQAKNRFRERSRTAGLPEEFAPADPSPPVTQMLEQEAMRSLLSRAIAALPHLQKAVVSLRVNEQLAFSEIAAIVGCSTGSAKVNYHHGVKRLREMLQAHREREG